MVYLCGRMIGDGYSMLGRETALDPVSWTADGWPVVNGLKGPSVLQKRPDLPVWMPEEEPDIGWNPKWMTPRAPEPEGIRFLSSGIRIKGSCFPLRDVAAKNILLQRQTSFCFTAETELVIPELTGGQEAGLVCYYDENTWVCLAVCRENSYYIQVKEHIGDKDVLHERQMLPCDCSGKKISLKVETEYLKRRFTYRLQGGRKTYSSRDCECLLSMR